jgi:Protein of unknown function (DUF2589)
MINTPIDFGEMIGAPLHAIIQGETIAAQASADFIQTVGFVSDGVSDSFGALRMISFQFERRSEAEQGKVETATMRVPLLSLIPIPLLQVKNATIEFGLNITSFESGKTATATGGAALRTAGGTSGNSFVGIAKPSVKVLPQPIPTKSTTTQDTTTKVDLQMKLNIVQADIPSGLAKLFSAFEAAMGEIQPVAKTVETVPSVEVTPTELPPAAAAEVPPTDTNTPPAALDNTDTVINVSPVLPSKKK